MSMARVNQKEIERIARQTQRRLDTVILEFGQDMAAEALKNTPVDTGFLRGSWFISINRMGTGQGKADPTGQSTVAEMGIRIAAARPGDTLYFLNGANYARFVEYGTSRMQGQGFVRRTVANARNVANRTIARIKK